MGFFVELFIVFSFIACTGLQSVRGNAELKVLMEMKAALDPANKVLSSWTSDGNPCMGTFVGVACNEHGKVANISLVGKGLSGKVPPAVAGLKCLSGLYLHYNSLSGEIPREISNLTELTDLYLDVNNLSGIIPPEIGSMASLQVLQLCCNQLNGSIPTQLGSLKKLSVVVLQHNQLNGAIPASLGDLVMLTRLDLSFNHLFGSIPVKLADVPRLEVLDIRNNTLSGNVPPALKRLNAGFQYENNTGLCGVGFSSLGVCPTSNSLNPKSIEPFASGTSGIATKDIPEPANLQTHCNQTRCSSSSRTHPIAVVVGVIAITVAVTATGLLTFSWYRRQKQKIGNSFDTSDGRLSTDQAKDVYRKNVSPLISLEYSNGWDTLADGRSGNGFSQELLLRFMFNLEEVESATQYFSDVNLLGKSNFSATYKGILRDGSIVAIKSINKTSCKSEEAEFLKGLHILTSLRHENLVGLRGFCCSRGRGECFLIYDFVPNGNLSCYFDLEEGDGRILEWSTRVSIINGIAKGIGYLHGNRTNKPALVHQNISAEKVLIDKSFNPLLSDSGLQKLLVDDIVFSTLKASAAMGYLAPEYTTTGRFTQLLTPPANPQSASGLPLNMSSNRFNPLASTPRHLSPAAAPSTSNSNATTDQAKHKKRKGHRGGKKKRARRKSFAILDDDGHDGAEQQSREAFYKMPTSNISNTSIDSEVLLDHRDHQPMRIRRSSTAQGQGSPYGPSYTTPANGRLRSMQEISNADELNDSPRWDESAPLLLDLRTRGSHSGLSNYGASDARSSRPRSRRASVKSSATRLGTANSGGRDRYDVNHPPSMPGSPTFGANDRIELSLGDVMIRDELSMRGDSPRRSVADISDIGGSLRDNRPDLGRRAANQAEHDVCFPGPGMSEMGDDETQSRSQEPRRWRTRRRRGQWPDLGTLEEWSHMEKEGRSEERRVKRITEPQLINGRLRPVRKGWFQTDEESPYRFTYFNEEFQSTIHSQTISELVQSGNGFRELFIPDPRILSSDDESDEDDPTVSLPKPSMDEGSKGSTRHPSISVAHDSVEFRTEGIFSLPRDPLANVTCRSDSGRATPSGPKFGDDVLKPTQSSTTELKDKVIRYGERPVWWLDILCPTEPEMKVIAKAFGIHPLTAEDIMVQEAREKVELFRHYYFVNYRSFDQDSNSDNFLEPVDMYVVVFREGVLSFHFSVTPHPANVRRRIRQLKDYLILSSDWISYAIIDDITDVFQPLIQSIEDEVDEIDDAILRMHTPSEKESSSRGDDAATVSDPGSDMLRRVGDCRKRVMSLYRLLGNKADVIKGFAKRCNERWEVAPRSEIGLYLGDIQDHIVTMTSNLSHYEKLLARSHGNYLAQINIRMNERQEQTADVLGKLTVLGTIVLPMNIITGLWGMNVWVPGQEYEGDLTWFVWIAAGLIFFGLACYLIAKRVYNIV